jgi:hypothetical protein
MRRILASVLLTAGISACDQQQQQVEPREETEYHGCVINWSGRLATPASAFNVQVCWNDSCTGDVPVQSSPSNGSSATYADAGCAPTSGGGEPSSCEFTPGPGCGVGDAGEVTVQACAASRGDDTEFSIVLSPTAQSVGGQIRLNIATSAGNSLVQASANVTNDDLYSGELCRGASFDLEGRRLVDR